MTLPARSVADSDSQLNFEALDKRTLVMSGRLPTPVTTLPTAPTDGQEVYYVANATDGVTWHLRYRAASASAYKWEFVGGNDLRALGTTWAGNIGAAIANIPGGPSISAPLSGDYFYDASFSWTCTAASIMGVYAGFNSVGLSQGNALRSNIPVANYFTTVRFPYTSTLAAGQAATIMVNAQGGGVAVTIYEMFLFLRPIRVG